MKRKKLSVLAVCLALLLGLLAGCGGGDDAEITAEDFYGCWEYEAYDLWLVVHEDEAYDWISPTDTSSGTYTVEDGELVLDNSMRYTQDGKGGLVDSDGDALFASELPEEGQSGGAASIEDFYGCWEYDDTDIGIWIDIRDDGTYIWHWGIGSSSGEYYLEGEELVTDNGRRYTLDGMGGLVDDEGDTLSPSQLPDSGSDGDESVDEDIFQSFVGYWGYDDYDVWAYIYDDGTCEWYDAEGLYGVDTYYVEDGILYLEQEDVTYEAKFGGLIASNGSTLFSSLLPDYDGTAMNGGEDFLGCWEDAIDDVWLEINSDGTYLFMWDDGYGSAGDCYMDGDELCLESGTRFVYNSANGWIVSDDGEYEMFPSEMPEHLR